MEPLSRAAGATPVGRSAGGGSVADGSADDGSVGRGGGSVGGGSVGGGCVALSGSTGAGGASSTADGPLVRSVGASLSGPSYSKSVALSCSGVTGRASPGVGGGAM